MACPMPPPAESTVVRDAIDVARFPWIRPLVGAYAHDFASVAPLFAGDPADPAGWRDAIARANAGARRRDALARVLLTQLARRGAPPPACEAAERLGHNGAVAIVTGQQAGLFGGPLYTLLKAISAVRLARRISAEHHVTAVPVFWVDEEDHDWAEVRAVRVLTQEGDVRDLALPPLPGAGVQPIARVTLEASVAQTIDELAGTLPLTEFSAELMDRLRRHYRAGVPLGRAFAGWLDDLLGRHGLVVFEAADPGVKPLVADIFARELAEPSLAARLARQGAEALAHYGHAPQVDPAEDAVSLFYLDGAGRQPITRAGGDYVIGGRAVTRADLEAEARAHPARFSPNVLVRPLVEDRLFPTAAYVAGPSELAYLAQLGRAYEAFEVPRPLLYPRASATLLDAGAMRFLVRSGLPFESLARQDESALNALIAHQLPEGLDDALAAAGRDLARHLGDVKRLVAGVDPTLVGATNTTVDRAQDALRSLQQKIVHASKRKDETLRRQFTRTRTLAFPDGQPQERALGLVFFVNRYGHALCDRLVDALPLEMGVHHVLSL